MPITWKNVAAPNFSGAQQGMNAAGNAFDKAISGLTAIGQQQQDIQQANVATGSQLAETALKEHILKNTGSMDTFNAYDFAGQADMMKGLQAAERDTAFKFFMDREKDLEAEASQQLEDEATKLRIQQSKTALGKAAKEAERDAYLDSAKKQITDAYAQGKTIEEIRSGLGSDLAKGKYGPDVMKFIGDMDKQWNGLTVTEQNQVKQLDMNAKLEYESGVKALDTHAASIKTQYPVDDVNLTPVYKAKTHSDVMKHLSEVAPEKGWFSVEFGSSEGEELQSIVKDEIKTATDLVRAKLPRDMREGYEIPVDAIQLAVESMPVDDSGEMGLSAWFSNDEFQNRIVDYAIKYRMNEVNRKQQTNMLREVDRQRKEYEKRYQDTIFNNPKAVKKLTRGQ